MTLILTTVHRHYVTQVVDRLVSRLAISGIEQFDPDANKTVVFSARDALVTLAYTGFAYINRLPTDQWIVETLRDRPVSQGPDGRGPAMLSLERFTHWPNVGQAVTRLTTRLEAEMNRIRPSAWGALPSQDIVIAGWQQYRSKRPRAFGVVITKAPGRQTKVNRVQRHLGCGVGLIAAPDGFLSRDEQLALLNVVVRVTPVEAEQALVAEIRKVAARTDLVGPHCMSVMLAGPLGRARIRYDSPSPTWPT